MTNKLGMAVASATASFMISIAPAPLRAQSFEVRPVLIETRDGIASVTVTNPTDRRIYIRSTIMDWGRSGSGEDALTESREAVASPPATWIEPRGTYNLRLRLPAPPRDGAERPFRVVLQNLPDRQDMSGGRVVFAITQSIPAFYQRGELAAPSLSGRVVGQRQIRISNDGGRRVRISQVSQGGQVLGSGLLGYALPGTSLLVNLTAGSVRPGRIEVQTDLGLRFVDLN